NSPINKTLVAAVKAGGLVDTLNSPGPFTVFAPTDDAFAKLPPGTVETLVKPENKDTLDKILTYHVVAGKISARQLEAMIKKGGGKASLFQQNHKKESNNPQSRKTDRPKTEKPNPPSYPSLSL